ncbi:hypothetical protein BD769DRAFT_1378817, partial [Suillus cothurnatus]
AAVDIMEKEGANLADRPRSIAVQETFSGGMRIVLEGSGEKGCAGTHLVSTKCDHRVLHAGLQPKVAETYEPIQTKNAKNLVLDSKQFLLNRVWLDHGYGLP